MPYYKIYAGLNGGYGGAQYRYTDEFEDLDEANDAAYAEASDIYDGMPKGTSLMSYEKAREEALLDFEEYDLNDSDHQEELENIIDEIIQEDMDHWIACWAEETESPKDDDTV